MLASMRGQRYEDNNEKKNKKPTPRSKRQRNPTEPNQAELVGKLLDKLSKKVDKEDVKGSVGDLIRLMQFQRELKEEQPKEITVKWVEPEAEVQE